MSATPPAPLGIVHLIADFETFPDEGELRSRVRSLLETGLPSLQIRAKGLPETELVRRGRVLREDAAAARATFIVHGSVEAAVELGAEGVHLPAGAEPLENLRRSLPGRTLGRSCHDASELAAAAGADWVFISPFFATASKPTAPPLGPHRFSKLLDLAPAPVYALGGIHAGNFRECLDAGAAGCAAIRGLLDPGGEEFLKRALALGRAR